MKLVRWLMVLLLLCALSTTAAASDRMDGDCESSREVVLIK